MRSTSWVRVTNPCSVTRPYGTLSAVRCRSSAIGLGPAAEEVRTGWQWMADPRGSAPIVGRMADPAPHLAIPLSDDPPLRDLWRFAKPHRAKVFFASTFSVLNKAFDVAPELLIGAAVDVVAQGDDSLVATVFGVDDKFTQLSILVVLTVVIWIC